MTQALLIEQGYYYRDAFNVFRAHADDLFAVTVWGLTDGRSGASANGAPLIFNDGLQAKPAYYGAVGRRTCRPGCARRTCSPATCRWTRPRRRRLEWRKLPLHPVEDVAGSSCAGHRTT